MTLEQLNSPALRSLLSEFIAETVLQAHLPPLTEPEDQDFVGDTLECLVDAFWEAYVSQLGELAQEQLLEAGGDGTGEKLWRWLQEYADFEKNEGARLLAQEIMADFRDKLPQILPEAYEKHPGRHIPLPEEA
jgi:hypothetical protein